MPDAATDINAFLDAQDTAESEPAPETDAQAPEAAPEAAAAEQAEPTDPFDAGSDTFDRPYVEKLRRENQNYRQRAKAAEDVFEGYDGDERAWMVNQLRGIKTDPVAALAEIQRVYDSLSSAQQAEVVSGGEERPLTAADVSRILDERDQRSAQAARKADEEAKINDVFAETRKLGYTDGSPEQILTLHYAANHDVSVADAAKALKSLDDAKRQKIIDEYVAQKADDSDATPAMATPGGSAPSGEHKIANLADAKAATIEFLKNQR